MIGPCGTDFASVPALLRPVFSAVEPAHAAATVFHDAGYSGDLRRLEGATRSPLARLSRAQVDRMLLDLLAVAEVPFVTRTAMWAACRLGGVAAWRRGIMPSHGPRRP